MRFNKLLNSVMSSNFQCYYLESGEDTGVKIKHAFPKYAVWHVANVLVCENLWD